MAAPMSECRALRHKPGDVLFLVRPRKDASCRILPPGVRAKLTLQERDSIGREMARLSELNPGSSPEEDDRFRYYFYRDVWVGLTLEFMISRGIDWTQHPRYSGDYDEDELDLIEEIYEDDLEYLASIDPCNFGPGEQELVDQLNALGDPPKGENIPPVSEEVVPTEETELIEAPWTEVKGPKKKGKKTKKDEKKKMTGKTAQDGDGGQDPMGNIKKKFEKARKSAPDKRPPEETINEEEKERIIKEYGAVTLAGPFGDTDSPGAMFFINAKDISTRHGHDWVRNDHPPGIRDGATSEEEEGFMLVPYEDGGRDPWPIPT